MGRPEREKPERAARRSATNATGCSEREKPERENAMGRLERLSTQ